MAGPAGGLPDCRSHTLETLSKTLEACEELQSRNGTLRSTSCGGVVSEARCRFCERNRAQVSLRVRPDAQNDVDIDADADAGGDDVFELPLTEPDVAERLRSHCKRSPFGVSRPRKENQQQHQEEEEEEEELSSDGDRRVSETRVDRIVRDSWQMDPSQFRVSYGPCQECTSRRKLAPGIRWPFGDAMQALGLRAATALGVPVTKKRVRTIPYKLLLYEEGGHFETHRDTEKIPGMFATLVVTLPSLYTGGTLTVHGSRWRGHSGGGSDGDAAQHFRSVDHDFGGDGNSERSSGLHFAAHYADAPHELSALASGYRVVVVYSLTWSPLPDSAIDGDDVSEISLRDGSFQEEDALIEDAADSLLAWDLGARVAALQMAHRYTEREVRSLGFEALKGKDRSMAEVLRMADAAGGNPCEMGFALAKLEVISGAEGYGGRGRHRRGWHDDYDEDSESESSNDDFDEYDWEEVDRNLSFGPYFSLVGGETQLPFEVERISLETIGAKPQWEENDLRWWGEADDEDFEGYSGNAGPEKTTHYSRALLLVWAKKHELELAASSSGSAVLAIARKRLSEEGMDASRSAIESFAGMQCSVREYLSSRCGCSRTLSIKRLLTVLREHKDIPLMERVLFDSPHSQALLRSFSENEFKKPTLMRFLRSLDNNGPRKAALVFSWELARPASIAALPLDVLKLVTQFLPVGGSEVRFVRRVMRSVCSTIARPTWEQRHSSGLDLNLRVAHGFLLETQAQSARFGLNGVICDECISIARAAISMKSDEKMRIGGFAGLQDVDLVADISWLAQDESLWSDFCEALSHAVVSDADHAEGEAFTKRVAKVGLSAVERRRILGLAAQRLVEARIRTLEGISPPTRDGWRMEPPPHFRDTEVQKFLRDRTRRSLQITGFRNIHAARSALRDYVDRSSLKYSVSATEGGRGTKSYIVLRKTQSCFERGQMEYSARQRELKELRSLTSEFLFAPVGNDLPRSDDQIQPALRTGPIEPAQHPTVDLTGQWVFHEVDGVVDLTGGDGDSPAQQSSILPISKRPLPETSEEDIDEAAPKRQKHE